MVNRYAPHAENSRSRALARVGRSYPPGWCLRWVAREIFGVPGVGDYDGDRAADAEDFWKAAVRRGDVVKTSSPSKIPAGVMVMWTGGRNDHGHAAYSLGDGMMVSTDAPTRGKIGKVKIAWVKDHWGLTLVGYIKKDANGYIYRKPSGKREPKVYKVVAEGGLYGRRKPNRSAKIVRLAKKGERIKAVRLAEGAGMLWAVTDNDVFYALGKGSNKYAVRV